MIILHTHNFFKVQGATEPFYLYNYLKKYFKVDVVTRFESTKLELLNKGDIYYIGKIKYISFLLWFNIKSLLLYSTLKPSTISIVYFYKHVFLAPLIAKFIFKKQIVVDLRSAPVEQATEGRRLNKGFDFIGLFMLKIEEQFYRFILKKCDLVITLSDGIKETLIEKYQVKNENIFILPLGVDLRLFKPKGMPAEKLPSNKSRLSLIVVSSFNGLTRLAGVKVVFKAIQLLHKMNIDTKLTLVGHMQDNTIRELRRLARKLQIIDYIEFTGYVSHDKIPMIIEAHDIAIAPIPNFQHFNVSSPAKLPEYLAMKKIVVASDIEANRRIIKNGINGLLYDPDNADQLKEKIVAVYKNEDLQKILITKSRESIRGYDWDIILGETKNMLEGLMQEGAS